MSGVWMRLSLKALPFADAATAELPLSRILRLSLFQVSVGMAAVLLTGTLNRVMIVELGMAASLVGAMIALPLLFAPLRALIGHASDHHRSLLGWKRVPYIWFGTLMQFGGLAILPFALLVMSGGGEGPAWIGQAGAALGFLLTGAGMHMTQTAGLALATDLAPEPVRPRVVALLYVMLLGGMMASALIIGRALLDFTPTRLVQIIQGVAALTLVLNVIALWKQEPRRRLAATPRPSFAGEWRRYAKRPRARRLLIATALGAAGFGMQDALLEPYGGQALGLSVGATTGLTALWALGMLFGFALAARGLSKGAEPHRLAGFGATAGIAAFAVVIFAAPAHAPSLLAAGAAMIGFGAGLFSVGTLVAAMALAETERAGLALGAWGAVQATAAGLAIAGGALLRDVAGYASVYALEIALLFATLIAVGRLVRPRPAEDRRFGLSEFPI